MRYAIKRFEKGFINKSHNVTQAKRASIKF